MKRVGDDVARELTRFGVIAGLAPLVEAWPSAVGPDIARNAWPARLGRNGTLHVNTSSAAWAFELRQPESDAANDSVSRSVDPSSQHAAAAAELTAQIDDEKLRKVVAKAAALSLA